MLVVTPKKYQNIKDADIKRSYQNIIDCILDFKEEHPQTTHKELSIFTVGVLSGRNKNRSNRR